MRVEGSTALSYKCQLLWGTGIHVCSTVPVKKKLKYRTVGAVAVRWRCGGGAVLVRSRYA